MALEYERKYRASKETIEKMASSDGFSVFHMETTYFDTKDSALSARHITLRCRRENEKNICTLKLPAAGIARQEFEEESNDIFSALPVLCKNSGFSELLSLTAQGIVPVCGARFTRKAKQIHFGASTLELCLDTGVLLGGGKEIPLNEVEVELLSGRKQDADLYGNMLAAKFALEAETCSKFRRALALAKGE